MRREEKNSDIVELKTKIVKPIVIDKRVQKNGKDIMKIKDNFVAPDGGWGWIIILAVGFSNLSIFSLNQSFGLIFRDRFLELGISSSEMTTLININKAATAFTGLANGPIFRNFSTRKVSFIGGLICASSITLIPKMETFTGFLIFFSFLYGIGVGVTSSANALTLNTYFKEKRRIAVGLSCTCTGMGTVVMPQLVTQLLPIYGTEGTVLICGGLAFNSLACSLLFQPISWHAKKKVEKDPKNAKIEEKEQDEAINEVSAKLLNEEQGKSLKQVIRTRRISIRAENISTKEVFGSQYLYYDDEKHGAVGIDVMELGTPMISHANDGWSSKIIASNGTLAVNKTFKREDSAANRRPSLKLSRRPSLGNLSASVNRLTKESEDKKRRISNAVENSLVALNEISEDEPQLRIPNMAVDNSEKFQIRKDYLIKKKNSKYWLKGIGHSIVVFFDLELLRDPIYANLMLGVTFANFTENNFSLLTPFILGEYGFTKVQVATFMSICGGVDVLTRIIIPFVATIIGWDNRVFFLLGISGLAAGRIVLAHIRSYGVSIAVAVLMGIGRALHVVFTGLVIPAHVPLSRLPAASGLQLVASGIIFLCVGPIVGWLKDFLGDYIITLHFLNIFTYLTVISWNIETLIKYFKRKNVHIQELQN